VIGQCAVVDDRGGQPSPALDVFDDRGDKKPRKKEEGDHKDKDNDKATTMGAKGKAADGAAKAKPANVRAERTAGARARRRARARRGGAGARWAFAQRLYAIYPGDGFDLEIVMAPDLGGVCSIANAQRPRGTHQRGSCALFSAKRKARTMRGWQKGAPGRTRPSTRAAVFGGRR